MDYATLRQAPFYNWGYTEEEIERGDAPEFKTVSSADSIGNIKLH